MALDVVGDQDFNEGAVLDAVQDSVCKLFGEYGASKANIRLIKGPRKKGQVVIRCSHIMLEKVRAAVASILEVDGKPVAIHVLGVSGTLRALANKT